MVKIGLLLTFRKWEQLYKHNINKQYGDSGIVKGLSIIFPKSKS